MKALLQSGDVFLVKIADGKFYYGNGDTINAFCENAAQLIRFNPYMKDVSGKNIEIPKNIIDRIKMDERR